MKKNKSSISKASNYEEIGEYWDTHDMSDVWDKTKRVSFEFDAGSKAIFYPLEMKLAEKVRAMAKKEGLSSETLVNLWIQQKICEQSSQAKKKKPHSS